jgi:hypothetical protein
MFIPDPNFFFPSRIQGYKTPDTGSGSATLYICESIFAILHNFNTNFAILRYKLIFFMETESIFAFMELPNVGRLAKEG